MKQAAKEGKIQDKTPLYLKENVPSLQSFSLKQIASHKNREERYQKEGVYWQKKRSDKARKKQEMLTNQFTGAWTHYTDTLSGTRTDHMVESFQRISIE